jgi:hypothetical protein
MAMKVTRRKILKILGLTISSMALYPIAGCSNDENGVVSLLSLEDSSNAKKIIEDFCQMNFYGNIPISNNLKKSDFSLPSHRIMPVIKDYKIVNTKNLSDKTYVYVDYNYVGVHKGNDFYFASSNNSVLHARYVVKNNQIQNSNSRFISINNYKNFLADSLNITDQILSKEITNTYKHEHFILKRQKYESLINKLS